MRTSKIHARFSPTTGSTLMAETVDAVVVFTKGLDISENGFSAGGAVFPFRFIRHAHSFNIVGWPNTLRLSDIAEVKEEYAGFVSFCFADGTKTVCPKSKIKSWETEKNKQR